MKRFLFLILLFAMPIFLNAQEEAKRYYIYNIVNFEGTLKNEGFKVTVDNGKTIEKLRDENGKRIVFKTPAGALMYFISQGWELFSHGSQQKAMSSMVLAEVTQAIIGFYESPAQRKNLTRPSRKL